MTKSPSEKKAPTRRDQPFVVERERLDPYVAGVARANHSGADDDADTDWHQDAPGRRLQSGAP